MIVRLHSDYSNKEFCRFNFFENFVKSFVCRLRLGENTESIIYLLYVGMIIIIIHNVKSWSLVSSSSFLKIIKQSISVSHKINKIFFCNINIC